MEYKATYFVDCGVMFHSRYEPSVRHKTIAFSADSHAKGRIHAIEQGTLLAKSYLANPQTKKTVAKLASLYCNGRNVLSKTTHE